MRNNKGITLITLVIMIIIILILASVGTTTGLDVIRQSKYNRAVAEMKVMQIKVNEMYEEYKSGDLTLDNIGTDIPSSLQTKSETALTAIYGSLSNINTSDFKYYSADYIKNTLDVDGVENDYLVNIKTREVVLIDGTKNDGEMYYSLSQIDDEQFNVEYINPGITYSPDGGMYILPKNITSENNLNMNIALSLQDIPNNMSANDLSIKYAWSTSKDTEPSEWIQLPAGTTTITEDENSDITEAGEYYLWTKIEDNNGKALNTIVSKKFVVKNEYDVKVAVTFDANGGTANIENKNVIEGEQYGELATITTNKTGYTSNGWYTSPTEGNAVEANTIVPKSNTPPREPQKQTLYAHWTPNQYDVVYKKNYTDLPSEYQEVEYIESTGTQYIDTGYNASYQSRIYMDYAYTQTPVQARAFGCNSSNNNYLSYDAYINGSGYYAWACKDGTGNWQSTGQKVGTSRVILDFDSKNNTIKYTGGITYSATISTTRTTSTSGAIYVFADNKNEVPSNYSSMKLYSMFIENNGVKVRDFVPCYRVSDNKTGLYDKVNNVFYPNSGTGEFITGENTQYFTYDVAQNLASGTYTRTGYTFKEWNTKPDGTGTTYTNGQNVINLTSENNDTVFLYAQWKPIEYDIIFKKYGYKNLPSEYQQVEFIESTGTQYINLEIYGTNNLGVELEYAYSEHGDYNYYGIFGTNETQKQFAYISSSNVSGTTKLHISSHGTKDNYIENAINNSWHKVSVNKLNDKKIYFDNKYVTTGTNTAFTTTYETALFKCNDNIKPTKAKVKTLKIYNNSTLIRDYVPCYRKSDNKVGLYDIINNVFYTNNGTGVFLKGYDLTETANETMQNQHFVYGTSQNLTQNTYTREEAIFKGWNTDPDGRGIAYTDGQSVTNSTTENNGQIVLYAQWELNEAYFAGGSESKLSTITSLTNIKRFERYTGNDSDVQNLINNGTAKRIDDGSTSKKIYGWYTSGTVYWWTDAYIVRLVDYSYKLWSSLTKAEYIDVTGIDTSKVTSMNSMFRDIGANSSTIQIVGLESMNTSNVFEMDYMFDRMGYNATTWSIGDIGSWDTSNVKSMWRMFYQAGYKATTWNIGNIGNWDVSKVTRFYLMFNQAGSSATTWNIGDLSGWTLNTTEGADVFMSSMFYQAGYNATEWNIGNIGTWNTSQVTSMESMFSYAGYKATTWNIGNIGNWNVSNVKNCSLMFNNAGANATTWDIGNIGNWNVSNVTTFESMFKSAGYSATTWNIGDLRNWNTSNATTMDSMFFSAGHNATTWSIGDLSGWTLNTTEGATINMNQMFSGAGYRATTWNIGNIGAWDTSRVTSMTSMFSGAGRSATTWNIGNIGTWDTSQVTSMNNMFYQAGYNATTWNIGDIGNWNLSQVISFNSMFANSGYNATTWSIGDLSGWILNTTEGANINMAQMFNYAGYRATTWNVGNIGTWNTSQVTNMIAMFSSAGYSATTWNIGNIGTWDTSQVTSMNNMFYQAGYNATTWNIGDIGNWNVSNVTPFNSMFEQAGHSATTWNIGNLSGWELNTKQDANISMFKMFYYAGYSATTWSIGDLTNWDTSKVTSMNYMFSYAGYNSSTMQSLGTLKIYNSSINYMFLFCPKANGILNIYNNITNYTQAFYSAATSGSGIVVNYTSEVTNIDNIINTKSSNSKVTKGSLLN